RASSVALIQRPNLIQQVFFGNSASTGKIYQLDPTGLVYNDDGMAIDAFWTSGFFQGPTRMNFGYVSSNTVGAGSVMLTLCRGDVGNVTRIRGWTLNDFGFTNVERTIQKQAFRMGINIETNAIDNWFSCQGLEMWAAPASYAPVRGINA